MVAALILKDDIVNARWDELVVISVNVGGVFLLDFFFVFYPGNVPAHHSLISPPPNPPAPNLV